MRWLALAVCLAACGTNNPGPPRFTQDECRAVTLADASSGHPVMGAEDLALAEDGSVLWVSAYDRLGDRPGGIYRIRMEALSASRVAALPVIDKIRPHGLSAQRDTALFIGRQTDHRAVVERVTLTPQGPLRSEVGEVPCGANDLVSGWEVTTYTVDRGTCRGTVFERLFNPSGGRVESLVGANDPDRRVLAEGLRLPNGIVRHEGTIWVAEMRARRLVELGGTRTIGLPGAPDNLNSSGEGIVAALQPSLWRFGLYRYGHAERAPTRIVLVDPETEDVEVLYDDPGGRLLSGATAAVLTGDGMMIASSVRGERLLVCEEGR